MAQPGWTDKARIAGKVAVVGTHCLWERGFPGKATSARDVPHSYNTITPQWLTAVLCKNVPGGQVLAFKPTGGSVGTSTRQGLELTLNDIAIQAGIPSRIFTKCTDLFTQRLLLGLAGVIGGETTFYLKIRPHIDIEAPIGYYACYDQSSWRSMLLMEDIALTQNAKFISTGTYISRPMIEDYLANMAKWHGAFWEHPRFKTDLNHLRSPRQFLQNLIGFLSVNERAKKGVVRAGARIPAALQARTDDVYKALLNSFEINAQNAGTFLHGDPHIGQTYITKEDHIGIGDWSNILHGQWAYDYAYGLSSALTVADRRAWEQDLLRFYLDCLHKSGGPKLDFDAAWLSYRQHLPYPYICWLMTLVGGSSVTPDMQPEAISLDIVERTSHAIDDLDTIKALA